MNGSEIIVLVCGGRKYNNQDIVFQVLDQFPIKKIVNGAAPGADRLSSLWAESRQVDCQEYPADWSKGKAAGFIRNAQMLKEEQINLVIAFPGKNGTKDMIERSKKAGIEVIKIETRVLYHSSFNKDQSILKRKIKNVDAS